jgi:hypothetical protein
MPESSVILNDISHRLISDLTAKRSLELVMTVNATTAQSVMIFRDAAEAFDWA